MSFVMQLDSELEKVLTPHLKNESNENIRKSYVDAVNTLNESTPATIRNITSMPRIYAYSESIEEKLYDKKHYSTYVACKSMRLRKFVVEQERLDTLWPSYIKILSSDQYQVTRKYMSNNHDFLNMVLERKAYIGFPKESRMYLVNVYQSVESIDDILTYETDVAIEYLQTIAGFDSKTSALHFLKVCGQNPEIAANEEIYRNVHDKLIDAALKSKYTRMFKKQNKE